MSQSAMVRRQISWGARVRGTGVVLGVALVFAALTGPGLVWLAHQGLMVFQAPDKFTYDWRHALLSHREEETRKDIALVLINDDTISLYPHQTPVDRKLLAAIVSALDEAGARVIGLDFVFDRPTEKDRALVEAIKSAQVPIVLGAIDARGGARTKQLDDQKKFFDQIGDKVVSGHLLLDYAKRGIAMQDQTVRFMAPQSTAPGHANQKSFAELLVKTSGHAQRYVGKRGLISWLQPTTSVGSLTFAEYVVPELRADDATPDALVPQSWRTTLKGKIVIVGGAFADRDRHLIPLSVLDGRRVPGVVIHAHIAAQLIDGRALETLVPEMELVLIVVLAFIAFLLGRRYRLKRYELLIYLGGGIALVGIGLWLFGAHGIVLPSDTIFYSVIAGITAGHYSEWLFKRLPFSAATTPTSD